MLYLTNPDARCPLQSPSGTLRCEGCIAIGNYCGECSTCRAAISSMHDTLWKIIHRAKFPGDLDIRIMAAQALGLTLSDLEERKLIS